MRAGLLAPRTQHNPGAAPATDQRETRQVDPENIFGNMPDHINTDGQIAGWIEMQAFYAGLEGIEWEVVASQLPKDTQNDYVFGGDFSTVKDAWQEGHDEYMQFGFAGDKR